MARDSSGQNRNSQTLISRRAFESAFKQELKSSPYIPDKHNGMKNPYTGEAILDERSYEEYIREFVFHRLCEQQLQAISLQQSAETSQLRSHYESELNRQTRTLMKEHETELLRRRKVSLIRSAVLAVALIVIAIFIVNGEIDAAYEKGVLSGYATGKSDGYADGVTEGYRDGVSDGREVASARSYSGGSSSATTPPSSVSSNNQSLSYTVYVSKSGGKIHRSSGCSGMSNYYTMTYAEALTAGYKHCSKCY